MAQGKRNQRLKMLLAMEYIARCINDETIITDRWFVAGIPDGDIPDIERSFTLTIDDAESLEYLTEPGCFSEIMDVFLRCMIAARKIGGLYCGGVSSGKGRELQ